MRATRFGVMVALVLAIAAPAIAVPDNARILDESTDGVLLELTYGEPRWVEQEVAGTWLIAPSMKGAEPLVRPDRPILPSQTFTLAAPPDADVSVDVVKTSTSEFGIGTLPIAPRVRIDLDETKVAVSDAEVWAPGTASEAPSGELVEVVQDGFVRDRRVIVLRVNPLQVDPETGSATAYRRVRLRVEFDRGKSAESLGDARPDPYFDGHFRSLVVNRRTAEGLGARTPVRTRPPASPAATTQAKDGEAVKVYVNTRGLYKLTPADFTGLGVDPAGIDPRTLKVHVGGQEAAIYVAGEGDGSFDLADYLVFYGEGISGSDYVDTDCYWVSYGGDDGLRAATMDASVTGGADLAESFPWTEVLEQNNRYWGGMEDWEVYDKWFWDRQTAPATVNLTGTIHNPAVTSEDAVIRSSYHGKTDMTTNPDHHTRVAFGGTVIQDETWDGMNYFEMEDAFDHDDLVDGSNTFVVSLVNDLGVTVDQQYINRLEIDYRREYVAVDDALRFTGPAAGVYEFNVGGFDTDDVLVFDVTDPANIVRLTGIGVTGSKAYGAAFELAVAEGDWFEAAGTDGFAVPKDIKVDSPSNWATTANGADWILITHENFEAAAAPLVARRDAQGYRAELVLIEDIYDEFAYGVPEPMAIRDFLGYAYANWEAPAPLYVLLMGDATIDPLEYLADSAGRTLVPSYMVHTASMGATPSDNPLFLLSGDVLPDFFNGRVPAETAAYVTGVVNKIATSEDIEIASWHDLTTYVADDNPETFELMSDELIARMPDDYQDVVERLYIGEIGASAVEQGIRAAINAGRSIVNYFGHGSVENWAGELVFTSDDVPTLTNANRYPFVSVFNCLNGYFPVVELDRYCVNEALIRYANKGAAASFGPTGYGYSSEHYVLAQRIWNRFFQNDIQLELGAATTIGRIEAYTNYGASYEVIDTYLLFGDPAMQLRRDLTEIDSDEDTYTRDVDCDDLDPEIHPGAFELCDGVDNDCDEGADEGCALVTVTIAEGVNYLAFAADDGEVGTAAEIVDDIESQGGAVVELGVWNHTAGVWRIYDPEYPTGDFGVSPEDGFYILAGAASTWERTAQTAIDASLAVIDGFTLLGLPSDDYAAASDLSAAMIGSGCDVLGVSRLSGGTWETYVPAGGGTDFSLDRTTGYFVEGGGACAFDIEP